MHSLLKGFYQTPDKHTDIMTPPGGSDVQRMYRILLFSLCQYGFDCKEGNPMSFTDHLSILDHPYPYLHMEIQGEVNRQEMDKLFFW